MGIDEGMVISKSGLNEVAELLQRCSRELYFIQGTETSGEIPFLSACRCAEVSGNTLFVSIYGK